MLSLNNGIVQLTVSQLTEQLSEAYSALIDSETPLREFPSVMLWGPPGVGKSQGVRQIADCIRVSTGKKVEITDVRLLLFNPVDLRGIPVANDERTLAVWLKPKIFQMDDNPDVVNILFLDEITAAPPSVQAAAYQITLDRTVGEHRLPENCIVIAAGNRITDRSVAFHMPKALANRLCHIEVKGDATSWHDWALKSNVHPLVMGYLDYNSTTLTMFDSTEDSLAFPTPRSWEMVSRILRNVSDDVSRVYPLIVGCIGAKTAGAFRAWCEVYRLIPPMSDVFGSEKTPVPDRPELLFAIVAAMADYARNGVTQSALSHSIAYACRMPIEFRFRLFNDYSKLPNLKQQLIENTVFMEWVSYNAEAERS